MDTLKAKDWFSTWFDTKYYHILYQHRNDDEAHFFMQNLIDFLKLKPKQRILDLACGKGRHSIFLNSLGFDVIGADLSKNSISEAKKFENNSLHFEVHDMRHSFKTKFDAIFNLFTSFGYFENDKEDISVLKHIKNGLKPNGTAVIDFMNIETVAKNLIAKEEKTLNGITFHISRKIEHNFIVKTIRFSAEGTKFSYQERVKCISFDKISSYLESANLTLRHTFGDYHLNGFDPITSNRLILVVS